MRPRPGRRQRWLFAFLEALLENDEAMLSLLASNPFPDDPPTYVRVRRYRYRFTTSEERADTGEWWRRELVGTYVEPISLADRRGETVSRRTRRR